MLEIRNVSYQFDHHKVLDNINITVNKSETVAILGASGVGKSTLFNLIASNLPLQSGEILIDGQSDIRGKISYMLQKDMLFPHKTVIENVMLPLTIKGVTKKIAHQQAMALLTQFHLEKWANYYPHALSGGMRQRVAFLRTACFEREWVLLDEAFGALDAITRRRMHEWFRSYRQQMNWTTLMITHDVEEALILADKIYVMSGQPGHIIKEVDVLMQNVAFEDIIFQPEFLEMKRELLEALTVS